MTLDQELASFTTQVLEQNGCVVETQDDNLYVLLPDHVSRLLHLPEEVRFGETGIPLQYGSPVLDQLVNVLTQETPIVYGQIKVPYLKKAGFEQLLEQELSFGKVRTEIKKWEETRSTYMVLVCHYLAMSDERKEGLVQVVVHEDDGAIISDFPGRWSDLQPEYFPPTEIPPHFPFHMEDTIRMAMNQARILANNELADFYKSIRRHLNRDIKNTREYYEALKKEMEASLDHPHLSHDQRNERKAKIQELPDEMKRKIEDLKQKYEIHVTITSCAALRFLLPVVRLTIEIQFRKLSREIRVFYNPITRHLDPLVCEHCHETTRNLLPFEKVTEVCLCCTRCY